MIVVKFRGLQTGGLPPRDPPVVKIIAGVGYPFRARIVVVSGGWLPFGWLAAWCFFVGTWFPKAVPGVIW